MNHICFISCSQVKQPVWILNGPLEEGPRSNVNVPHLPNITHCMQLPDLQYEMIWYETEPVKGTHANTHICSAAEDAFFFSCPLTVHEVWWNTVWSLLVVSAFNATLFHISREALHTDLLHSEHMNDDTHMQHGFICASVHWITLKSNKIDILI